MSVKNIFDKPFDEGTMVKLEIFEKYFEEWLPTFVMSAFNKPIQIFDLFAGSGYDNNGIAGSPIRILEIINKHRGILAQKSKQVFLFLNDVVHNKIRQLKLNVDQKVKDLSLNSIVVINISSHNFSDCISTYHTKQLNYGCNLIFIDQNGFKHVNEEVFRYLINLETTEFIFFISSSYIHRFIEQDEVKKYHPKFDSEKIKQTTRKQIHNIICDEFSRYVPENIKSYGLIPFSIMKSDKNNVYGLIFVSKHIRGADKFLQTVWKENALNGNANFDIDEDKQKYQLTLFEGQKLTKIENFKKELRTLILDGKIKNNINAYFFTMNQGHIGSHANDEIKRMKKENEITFNSSSALVNYDKVIKEHRALEYILVKK